MTTVTVNTTKQQNARTYKNEIQYLGIQTLHSCIHSNQYQ